MSHLPTLLRFRSLRGMGVRGLQRGFTLIELMIVVAIIGILAALAVPAYQDYIAVSQATEAVKATSGLRADVAARYAESNTLAPSAEINGAAAALEGKYFVAGGVAVGAGGTVTVGFSSGLLSGETMILTPQPSASGGQIASWACTGLANVRHLPSGCR